MGGYILMENGNTQVVGIAPEVSDTIKNLLYLIKTGPIEQKHAACKALGYLSLVGVIDQDSKVEALSSIQDILENDHPPLNIAFALIEALFRINEDSFWTLIMSWYARID